MTERVNDGDAVERDEAAFPDPPEDTGALFGSYSVVSPGVEIVLEGRPVSAPAAD